MYIKNNSSKRGLYHKMITHRYDTPPKIHHWMTQKSTRREGRRDRPLVVECMANFLKIKTKKYLL